MESDSIELPSFLKTAMKLAKKSNGLYMLGSCLVSAGRFLSGGYNKYHSMNPLAREFFGYPTVHAEMDALNGVSKESIKGSVLYVFRIRRDGSPGMSMPCRRCQNALRNLGIRKVIYSTAVAPYWGQLKVS